MTLLGFHTDRASLHFGPFSLVRATSETELRRASAVRQQAFLERRGIALDEALEARRDEGAHVFLLLHGRAPVATARVSPFPAPLSPLPIGLCSATGADSELSRVACVRATARARHSLVLLTLGASYLLAHTDFRRYVAYAHPKLCAAHQRLGAVDTGGRCIVPQRREPYRILSGSYADTLENGKELLGIADLSRSA